MCWRFCQIWTGVNVLIITASHSVVWGSRWGDAEPFLRHVCWIILEYNLKLLHLIRLARHFSDPSRWGREGERAVWRVARCVIVFQTWNSFKRRGPSGGGPRRGQEQPVHEPAVRARIRLRHGAASGETSRLRSCCHCWGLQTAGPAVHLPVMMLPPLLSEAAATLRVSMHVSHVPQELDFIRFDRRCKHCDASGCACYSPTLQL